MKISGQEKIILALTAAVLLVMVGFFLLGRPGTDTYSVAAQTIRSQAVGEAVQTPSQVGLININTATAAQLETLPGIGEVKAGRIVADREANGPYRIPEDLLRVSGIGEGTLKELLDYITVE